MDGNVLTLPRGRVLVLRTIHESIQAVAPVQFAAMLPAFDSTDCESVKDLSIRLVDIGCIELCYVGPYSERLHDDVDWLIEERNALHVVTTWHTDLQEACEYFLYAAGGLPPYLVAFIGDRDELVSVLRNTVTDL